MTPAEFRCIREYLGLPLNWVAASLGVTERTVNRWETGYTPIPERAAAAMAQLSEYTQRCVDKLIRKHHGPLRTTADDERPIETWGFPASWHRMMVTRVAMLTGGDHIIEYTDGKLTDAGLTPVLNARAWKTVVAR